MNIFMYPPVPESVEVFHWVNNVVEPGFWAFRLKKPSQILSNSNQLPSKSMLNFSESGIL